MQQLIQLYLRSNIGLLLSTHCSTLWRCKSSMVFHMQSNLRFGCVILRHYLDIERGDMFLALGRYNGSRGRPEYPNAVFAARRQWLLPGRTGEAVPAKDVAGLAEAVSGLLDPERNIAFGRNAIQVIRDRFLRDQHLERLIATYQRIATIPDRVGGAASG